MKDTSNLSEFRSFVRAPQIAAGVIILLAFTLAGPPCRGDQCIYITNISTSATPSTVVDGTPTNMVLTFTLNTPVTPCNTNGGDEVDIIWGGFCPDGSLIFEGDIWLGLTQRVAQR